MTPDPTLTDEELAEMERVYSVSEDWHWVHGHAGLQRPLIRRLIAALRASGEREAVMQRASDAAMVAKNTAIAMLEEEQVALRASRAEVERLKKENANLSRMILGKPVIL
jgi:hypothetical protein